MDLIVLFAAMLGGFLIVGTVCAIAENGRIRRGEAPEEPSRVVVSQQVPSVFDTFKGGKE